MTRPATAPDATAPASGEALARMAQAHAHFVAFEFGQGHAVLEEVIALAPDFLPARWARFQLPRALSHESDAALDDFRAGWRAGVAEFAAIDWNLPRWRAQIWGCVGQCTAFYRHYLGDDVTDDMRTYGLLISNMMHALVGALPVPRPPARTRRRVVYISAYTYEHTVTRLFGPLLARLDRTRFETHLLQLDPTVDTHTDSLVASVASTHGGPREAHAWCNLLVELAADVIVYSDVGMHPLTQGLAALRLAPLQIVLWGHPVTTGLPGVDRFLSSDWFEPAEAEEHYVESLVRLPGIGASPAAPTVSARVPRSWPAATGQTFVELLCAQSVFKLLPAQCDLLVSILAAAPDARLHLTPHANTGVRDGFRARLGAALASAGGDPDVQLVLHPLLPLGEFRGLCARCDLGLDTIGWSGGMSAIDQLGEGLPVLTFPGESMRSRQTAALLHQLGVQELVANDVSDYLGRALTLIADDAVRTRLRERILGNRGRLYNTAPVHRAFAECLAKA